MNYRKLRIAWSVAWGIIAVLVCVMCLRSYFLYDFIGYQKHSIISKQGNLFLADLEIRPIISSSDSKFTRTVLGTTSVDPAHTAVTPLNIAAIVPEFPLVVPVLLLTAAPWVRWSNRFGLRTLLIVTTIVAILMGVVAWSIAHH